MLLKTVGTAAVALASAFLTPSSKQSGPPDASTNKDRAREVLSAVLAGRDTSVLRSRTGRARTGSSRSARIPPGQLPPAGMCRVWIDGVPPGRQPAVTDCSSAEIQAARIGNARVIYGDQQSFPGRGNGKFKSKSRGNDDRRVLQNGDDDDDRGVQGRGDDDENDDRDNRDARGGRPSWAGQGRGNSRGHGRHGG
jgi:hypothetical protein